MRFSYQTLYSITLNDSHSIESIERRSFTKQIQTAILKGNTLKESLYIVFFPFFLHGFYNQVWFQRRTTTSAWTSHFFSQTRSCVGVWYIQFGFFIKIL